MSTDFLNRQVTLQFFCQSIFSFERICVQTMANVVHATVCEDMRATLHLYAHALAQDELSIGVCFLYQSHLVVVCFIATCSVSLILFFSVLPRWLRNQGQLAPIHGAVHGLVEWLN